MREDFERWFTTVFPGMSLSGPNAKDEWMTWQAAYYSGRASAFKESNSLIDSVIPAVQPCR